MFARISHILNACLVGAVMALPFAGSGPAGLIAKAQQTGTDAPPQPPKIEGRLPATAAPLPLTAMPRTEGKLDAVVPPMIRKAPSPAPTSVPIVAPPEKKKGATTAAKPAAKSVTPAKAQPAAVKSQPAADTKKPAPAPAGRAGLGGPGPETAKCAAGFKYDTKQLKCVKAKPAAAAAQKKPAATPVAAQPVR